MCRLLLFLVLFFVATAASADRVTPNDAPAQKLFSAFSEPIGVGDFKLHTSDGEHVRARDMLGKIWVAQFFYPGCNLCSRNTPAMKRLQEIYRGKSDVRLVSVDLIDSLNTIGPNTLTEFGKSFEAEPGQWLFLTGAESDARDAVVKSFYRPAALKENPELGDAVSHSTDLMLIDHHGNLIGYVDGTKDGAAEALKEQIDRLRGLRRLEMPIPVKGGHIPRFNAMLNSACTILLLLGWVAIRVGLVTLHKLLMLLALAVSMAFLSSYVFYHVVVCEMEPMPFRGEGGARYLYFAILLSHTVLAIVVAPLAIFLTVQGLRGAFVSHVRLARWTLPIWIYVSVTGVAVYWMLYRIAW